MAKVVLIGIDAAIPTLVQKYFKDGKLPNMKKIADNGIWSECIPVFPTHTASNWNTVATGAWPKTHGVTDMVVHIPGTPLTEIRSGFFSDLCKAEQIWLTAEKFNKKSILLKYIASWPPNMKNGIQVEGFGAPGGPGSRPWGSSPLSISNSSCFSTLSLENSILVNFSKANMSDWTSSSSQQSFSPPPLETKIRIGPIGGITFNVIIFSNGNNEYDTAIFTKDKNMQNGISLKKNQISDWLIEDFIVNEKPTKAAFRMKLIDMGGKENPEFKLFVSQVFPIEGWTFPPALAKELVDKFGPFLESISHFPYVFGWSDENTYLDDAEYQARWMGDAADYLMSKYQWELFMTQWHGIDNTQHAFLRFDKSVLSENEKKVSENVVLRSYEIADELVGNIVRGVEKNKTVDDIHTIVLSDHGHVMGKRRFFINSYLYKNGIINLKKDPLTKKLTIDWENTKAYSQGMVSVYVNLKGRDPNGSVKPGKEYEEVVEKIIDLLHSIKDPKTGMKPISLALSNKDAEFIGLSGERTGDVIFAASPTYAVDNRITTGDLFLDLKTGLPDGSIHGAQLPTVDLGENGTIKSMFIAQGSKLKKHYIRENPINIIDIAPTMAYLLDIPPPKNSEGRIIYDLFE